MTDEELQGFSQMDRQRFGRRLRERDVEIEWLLALLEEALDHIDGDMAPEFTDKVYAAIAAARAAGHGG